jgi:hypothetical protein
MLDLWQYCMKERLVPPRTSRDVPDAIILAILGTDPDPPPVPENVETWCDLHNKVPTPNWAKDHRYSDFSKIIKAQEQHLLRFFQVSRGIFWRLRKQLTIIYKSLPPKELTAYVFGILRSLLVVLLSIIQDVICQFETKMDLAQTQEQPPPPPLDRTPQLQPNAPNLTA